MFAAPLMRNCHMVMCTRQVVAVAEEAKAANAVPRTAKTMIAKVTDREDPAAAVASRPVTIPD